MIFFSIENNTYLHIILPWEKNRYSREIYEADHVISCDIELRFDIDATRVLCASRPHVASMSHDIR